VSIEIVLGITAVFTSDLRRAAETAEVASATPTCRSCDGSPAAEVGADRLDYCDRPYPGSASHAQSIAWVTRFSPIC
jgi:hypothetical protein